MSPADWSARCPVCGEELFARRRGEWTVRTPMLKLDLEAGQVRARCPSGGCKGDVLVPFLTVQEPIAIVSIEPGPPIAGVVFRREVVTGGAKQS